MHNFIFPFDVRTVYHHIKFDKVTPLVQTRRFERDPKLSSIYRIGVYFKHYTVNY